MKATGSRLSRVLAVLTAALPLAASAVVFTHNTVIPSFDTNYDGADIVVSNCTLTVNGPHRFLSLLIADGGVLTYTFSGSGILSEQHAVQDEPHVLISTNPVSLLVTGALVTIAVTDTNLNPFIRDQDYVATQLTDGVIALQRTVGSAIPDGAAVLVSYTVLNYIPAGLWLSIDGAATVTSGGSVNATGGGYNGAMGPGAGHSAGTPADGSGGGYGGIGGTSSSNAVGGVTYGPFDGAALLFGSGGGAGVGGIGAPGGGLLHLGVGGTLAIDGVVTANGGDAINERSGGGSGGSVWLSAASITGTGLITANGGAGEPVHGGGGGGGRIAISCATNAFAGTITAYGGPGWQAGGAGTVYTVTTGHSGLLVLDNGGQTGTNTTLTVVGAPDVLIQGNAKVLALGSWVARNLTVASNGWLLALPLETLTIVAINITIQAHGAILADGAGYEPGNGQGHGGYSPQSPYYPCGGGGYGGCGGGGSTNAPGGQSYGAQNEPTTTFGSGGGGLGLNPGTSLSGYGGGAIHLTAGTIRVDGLLSASGTAGLGSGGGGGSGGSIWLDAATLVGAGVIAANGGSGVDGIGGGGGGGRIDLLSTLNNLNGVISAYGGSGANYGGAGTVYIQTSASNQLIVDNGGPSGTNTPIQSASQADVIIRNGAIATQNYPPQTFQNLWIGSNSWLTANTPGGNYPGQVNLTLTGNATIQSGGGIVTDGMGFGPGLGLGAGRVVFVSSHSIGGGGGHGGYGGGFFSGYAAGGIAQDDPIMGPNILGAGGGNSFPFAIGGAGGGYIRLVVNGTLKLDGIISANGADGSGAGGGGAGGSVWLTPGSITGSGLISANGGSGGDNPLAGGGGGGRIALLFNTNRFHGLISAYGGGLSYRGGAGTIYLRTNSLIPLLVLDNGGYSGTNSLFSSTAPIDVIVRGAAVAQSARSVRNLVVQSDSAVAGSIGASGSVVVEPNGTVSGPITASGNVVIEPNGAISGSITASGDVIIEPNGTMSGSITAASNVTIETNAAISADGRGYTSPYSGPGGGFSTPSGIRGGGGHGGWGGANPVAYGGAYDSILSPNQPGSAGGAYYSASGGAGGGVLSLNVTGVLTINGRISANGGDGAVGSGGGAGGAISINAGTLLGSGRITANGGAGSANAGGGAGGRISVYLTSAPETSFAGMVLAAGGNGIVPGGAGTIFESSYRSSAQLFIDNGGLIGTNTPFLSSYLQFAPTSPPPPLDLTVRGGATLQPLDPLPALSNLTVGLGGSVVGTPGQTNLQLIVMGNAQIAPGGFISATGRGFAQAQGPGAGHSLNGQGAGGGYGGTGGASVSGAAGGMTYGSAGRPTEWGSGGGTGANTSMGGSEGGGAVRMGVVGTLTVDGVLSADGNPGLQDNSGGGSGGGIWLSARAFTGKGWISANGGSGELYNGGGGGGGRIAIYSPANTYTGVVFSAGGSGANPGESGSLTEANFSLFQVISQTPSGVLTSAVSTLDLTFNDIITNANTSGFTLTTPSGPLRSNLFAYAIGPDTARFIFPTQTQLGTYTFELASGVTNLFGQTLSQVYAGSFTISLPPPPPPPAISGTVTDTNGQPVAGVLLQPTASASPSTTDTNGHYAVEVPRGWWGQITPVFGSAAFIPSSRSYRNVFGSITNQNFILVPTLAPRLSATATGGRIAVTWQGLAGVTYQGWWSTNLLDWQPLGNLLSGSNAWLQLQLPTNGPPAAFLRVQASD